MKGACDVQCYIYFDLKPAGEVCFVMWQGVQQVAGKCDEEKCKLELLYFI